MNDSTQGWTPIVKLDLSTASRDAFVETVAKFHAQVKILKDNDTLPPLPFDHDGWYDITPQMAEAALIHSGGNREVTLSTVKGYAEDMILDDWPKTGESMSIIDGKTINGHHRDWACYLSGASFSCYVVTSAPPKANIFAYLDVGKKRNAADALYIAGWNGTGKALASAVGQLALRYEAGMLGIAKQARFKTANPRTTLAYMEKHPELREAAQTMLGNYPDAVDVIRSKPAAIFFANLVLRNYDAVTLREFCEPFGSGANLTEDSPLLAARAKLMAPEVPGKKTPDRTRLAIVCKAFNMHINGEKMSRARGRVQPLTLDVDEAFPTIASPLTQAAE